MINIILILSAVFMLNACEEKNEEQSGVVRPIRAVQVGAEQKYSKWRYPGKAQASDAVNLAFEVSGKLNEIPISVGDRVTKGQVLASLNPRDFENDVETARAEVKRTKAQYDRMLEAVKSNAVSKQEVTNAQAEYESAVATLKIKQKALEDTVLRAPYDAIVATKYVKSFGNIQAKQDAIRLVDPTQIEMIINIPEDMISYAEQGTDVSVNFDAFPDLEIPGVISEVGAEASETTRTFPVTVIMDQPKQAMILPGMAGKAYSAKKVIKTSTPTKTSGFEVPVTSLTTDADGNSYVWVINQDTGDVKRTPVETGNLTKAGVLIKGLLGGEFIATAGVNVLEEGQKVRVIEYQKLAEED